MRRRFTLFAGCSATAVILGCSGAAERTGVESAAAAAGVPFTVIVVERLGPEDIWAKAFGDLDGDGLQDLVVGANKADGGGIVWYENPSWERRDIDAGSRIGTDAEVADLDGDGRPDVVAIRADQSLAWYQNPGWARQVISADVQLHDIEVADFDGDGALEIVGRNQGAFGTRSGAHLFLFDQQPSGTWARDSIPIPDGEGLVTADINGDGRLDVVVNNSWYENTGRFTGEGAWREHTYTTRWTHENAFVDAGDINGDGRVDIILAPSELAEQRYRISWFEAPEDPTVSEWTEHVVDGDVEAVHHYLGVADFNQDGHLDISTAEMEQGQDPDEVKIYLNAGGGAAWHKQVIYTGGSHSMRILDVDNNGVPDLFGGNWRGREVLLWVNNAPPSGAAAPVAP